MYHFGGPHNKDYSIGGFTLGSPCFRKLASVAARHIARSPQEGFLKP